MTIVIKFLPPLRAGEATEQISASPTLFNQRRLVCSLQSTGLQLFTFHLAQPSCDGPETHVSPARNYPLSLCCLGRMRKNDVFLAICCPATSLAIVTLPCLTHLSERIRALLSRCLCFISAQVELSVRRVLFLSVYCDFSIQLFLCLQDFPKRRKNREDRSNFK